MKQLNGQLKAKCKILEAIFIKKSLTIEEIVASTGMPKQVVEKYVDELLYKGLIDKQGSKKFVITPRGEWFLCGVVYNLNLLEN
jgi:predicted transcriptional regulator